MTKNGKAKKRMTARTGAGNATRTRRYAWIPFVLGFACAWAWHASVSAQDSVANIKPRSMQQSQHSGDADDGGQNKKSHAEDVQRAVEQIFEEPLSGVVVNRTVTVLGKEFYRHFSIVWRHSPQSNRYSISIHERPSARFGSEVWILYRQQRVFHTFLPPARPATKEVSEYAVEYVLETLARRELERFTAPDPDLGPEEL